MVSNTMSFDKIVDDAYASEELIKENVAESAEEMEEIEENIKELLDLNLEF